MSDTETSLDCAIGEIEATLAAPKPKKPRHSRDRPSRQTVLPARLNDSYLSLEQEIFDPSRPIIVQCCQTGKKLNVRVKDVTTEDCQSLTESDFVSGANLILNHKGKSYPVQFVEFKGNHKAVQSTKGKGKGKVATKTKKPPSKRKIAVDDAENKLDLHTPLQDRTNVLDILSKAKGHSHPIQKKRQCDGTVQDTGATSTVAEPVLHTMTALASNKDVTTCNTLGATSLDDNDKNLIAKLSEKIEAMDKKLDLIYIVMKNLSGVATDIKPECKKINGINVMMLPTRDAYSFGLQLMDLMFTKEEQSTSCIIIQIQKEWKTSIRSNKGVRAYRLGSITFWIKVGHEEIPSQSQPEMP